MSTEKDDFVFSNVNIVIFSLQAMLHLASKLNYKNLNEELMKHFARLQSKDDQVITVNFVNKDERLLLFHSLKKIGVLRCSYCLPFN